MRKIIITILIFVMIAPIPASVFAGEKKWQREENGPNKININGECQGGDVAILIYPQNSQEPVYSAGAECKNGRFNFKDDLSSWNIPEGSYRLSVGKDDFGEEMVVERNASADSQPSLEIKSEEPPAFASPVEPVSEEQNQNTSQENIEDSGFISRITQIVKSVLASLGLFIENGIARLETLTARTIVVERLEAELAIISKAEIQNLKVSEKFEVKDQATGEIYCNWIENGEWTKAKSSCEDLAKSEIRNPKPETPDTTDSSDLNTGQANLNDQNSNTLNTEALPVEQPTEQSPVPSLEGEVLDQGIPIVVSDGEESSVESQESVAPAAEDAPTIEEEQTISTITSEFNEDN